MTEFGFIEQIKALCASLPNNNFEGIGDDCAVLPIGNGDALLFTQDMLIERVHFLRDASSPYELGQKSLAVNISDIAAMGARPIASLLSLSIPKELTGEWIEQFMVGYRDISQRYGVALIGGDTTASKGDFTINITAIGQSKLEYIKRRSDAKVGDIIAVTGELGGSGMGLRDILNGQFDTPSAQLHKGPTPRIEQGIWLGYSQSVHAMMDISDGVASDLRHILKASGTGAQIELSSIPISHFGTTPPSQEDLEFALSAGEDYELLLTIEADNFDKLSQEYLERFNTPLYPIGKIIAGNEIVWLRNDTPQTDDFKGFTHY